MDRRLPWDEFEKNYPVEYAKWIEDAVKRAKEADYVICREDGRLDLTTNEGAHWEEYWVWDGTWRKQKHEEIRGAIYK